MRFKTRGLPQSINDNGELGIDLGGDGVTDNDPILGDGDTGENNLQNYPMLTKAAKSSTKIVIEGYGLDDGDAQSFEGLPERSEGRNSPKASMP